jgi:hypothetical protein
MGWLLENRFLSHEIKPVVSAEILWGLMWYSDDYDQKNNNVIICLGF